MSEGLRDISNYDHEHFMRVALAEAKEAGERGDIPIGAVIVHGERIVARGGNRTITTGTDIRHAEADCVRAAAGYLKAHGRQCLIYTTIEPCFMCLATIVQANIRNVIFAVSDRYLKTGEAVRGVRWISDRLFNYKGGVLCEEADALLREYCSTFDYNIITKGEKGET